ncbi:uncharacterized protein [Henckelia pumila]|uniref:uncharacterized protein n=1 Tax=Henckelia pumila TaxID=405737 RepID=UPI003C6E7E1B
MMDRRTLTMNWDGLGDDDDDDRFFESFDRISAAVPLDLASSGSDDDDFEDSRMSFVSAVSSASIKSIRSVVSIRKPSSLMDGYGMWMAEPGDINERRKRLFQGMGLSSNKEVLKLASSKVVRAISRRDDPGNANVATSNVESCPTQELKPEVPSHDVPVVLSRSRSDGDIEAFSAKTKQRKEEIIGPESKQRLTRTSSGQLGLSLGVCQYSNNVRISPRRSKNRTSMPPSEVMQSVLSDGAFGSFFLIKNLDTGKEFIVKEYNEQGMWNKLSDVQTGKQLTMEEFERSVGYSPVVKELMRRENGSRSIHENGNKMAQNSYLSKSFRNSKRRGAAILKNIKLGVTNSMSGLIIDKEQEHTVSAVLDQKDPKNAPTQWVKARQHGKSYKEFTALHMSQVIQAHSGSIWTIRFSCDARFLASAGEDRMIHVWEVQECDVMSARLGDDSGSFGGTPVHPMAGAISERPPPAELTPSLSERRKKGKTNKKKGHKIPDYVNMPETVFALSEKPVCTFQGHQDDVLDLSWSKSQLLLSSSMDKTVRMWDLESKSCLKMFAHNDYVTCIQFNPVNNDYFISGSLDAKVRIWSIPDRQVVDWTDLNEMVTAACYTPDGQGAVIGSHKGGYRTYSIDADCKLEQKDQIEIKKKKKVQAKKITGFQFSPSNSSEVLITSADSRIRILNGLELIQKLRGMVQKYPYETSGKECNHNTKTKILISHTGFRNTSSQISASFSADGKHVISASEDSQVYIWKLDDSKNPGGGKGRTGVTIFAHEHFNCKDVSVAIPWPGSARNEPPMVEIHSKRHSKRSNATPPQSLSNSPTKEDNRVVGASSRRHLPPLPKKNNILERITSSADDEFAHSSRIDPGIGVSESFGSSSQSLRYDDPSSISASGNSPSQSWSSSWNLFDGGSSQTVQATAWGMVVVTASLGGELRVYQNFGLPVKVSRQANLFRDH